MQQILKYPKWNGEPKSVWKSLNGKEYSSYKECKEADLVHKLWGQLPEDLRTTFTDEFMIIEE